MAVSFIAVLKLKIIESRTVSSLSMMVRGANFPPVITWNLWDLSAFCGQTPSDTVLTPAVLPITRRLVEGGNVLFLPVQVQRTCPLPSYK